MASDWRLLPKTKPAKPFLARTLFEKFSYTIHITDLTSIWTEMLSREEIISRSKELANDIHPEDDSSQFGILLEKIGSAFQDDEGTEIFVRPFPNKLELFLRIPLPGGLNDLQWSVNLAKQPFSALQSEIINPVVALAYVQKQQIDQLSQLLNEKDSAIGKILDKIDSQGLDYGTMFPTAVRLNRKSHTREQTVRQVKGLAVFNRHEWTATSHESEPGHLNADQIAPAALAGCHAPNVQSVTQCLPVDTGVPSPATLRLQDADATSPRLVPRSKTQSQSQADEFQRQVTPEAKKRAREPMPDISPTPHRSPAKHSISKATSKPEIYADEEETTDEENLDGGELTNPPPSKHSVATVAARSPNVASRAPSSSPVTAGARPKLGAIGSRKTAIINEQKSKSMTPDNGKSPTPDPAPLNKGNKLGKIGGRKAAEPASSPRHAEHKAEERNNEEDTAMPDAHLLGTQPTKRKLGKIGGQRFTPNDADAKTTDAEIRASRPITPSTEAESAVPSIEPARPATPVPAPASLSPSKSMGPEEDAKAKADRKRDEMKKELESGKSAPKKKRRF